MGLHFSSQGKIWEFHRTSQNNGKVREFLLFVSLTLSDYPCIFVLVECGCLGDCWLAVLDCTLGTNIWHIFLVYFSTLKMLNDDSSADLKKERFSNSVECHITQLQNHKISHYESECQLWTSLYFFTCFYGKQNTATSKSILWIYGILILIDVMTDGIRINSISYSISYETILELSSVQLCFDKKDASP